MNYQKGKTVLQIKKQKTASIMCHLWRYMYLSRPVNWWNKTEYANKMGRTSRYKLGHWKKIESHKSPVLLGDLNDCPHKWLHQKKFG